MNQWMAYILALSMTPITASSGTGTQDSHGGVKSPDMSEAVEANTVIGRPFPVSKANQARCERLRDEICKILQQRLARLQQEPRDPIWASKMESLIQNDVLYEEQPGRFSIRHIECRNSICAAEVESKSSGDGYGAYPGGIQAHHDSLRAVLHTDNCSFAYEIDSSGARVTVTLITFTRRDAHE
jgi:hypothetical protein